MAKTLVLSTADGTRMPFLRGILTRSLQHCGVPFEQAYQVASEVRADIADREEISSDDLRALVTEKLEAQDHTSAEQYALRGPTAPTILMRETDGHVAPFSRGRHRLGLECSGIPTEDAQEIVEHLYRDWRQQRVLEIGIGEAHRTTYEIILEEMGEEAALRYVAWHDYRRSGRPLVVLISGVTGSGKSTMATEIAHLADFMRTQSTDMLREVMRVLLPRRLLPVLHLPSFEAWRALPEVTQASEDPETRVSDGFATQARLLRPACEAVIDRALDENVSLVLEGVHVMPTLASRLTVTEEAVVVPVMLAVMRQRELKRRLKRRGDEAPSRHAQRHVSNVDSIWALQAFLLAEADRAGIPIIVSRDRERTLQELMTSLVETLAASFNATADEVFGPA